MSAYAIEWEESKAEEELGEAQEYVAASLVRVSWKAWVDMVRRLTPEQTNKINDMLNKVDKKQSLTEDEMKTLIDFIQPAALAMKIPPGYSTGNRQRTKDQARIKASIEAFKRRWGTTPSF